MKRRERLNSNEALEKIQEILKWELARGHAINFGRRFMYEHLQEQGYHILSWYILILSTYIIRY